MQLCRQSLPAVHAPSLTLARAVLQAGAERNWAFVVLKRERVLPKIVIQTTSLLKIKRMNLATHGVDGAVGDELKFKCVLTLKC